MDEPQGSDPAVPIGERIRRAGTVAWAVIGMVALLTVVGIVAWWMRIIWPPLILAGAIVFLLNPIVTALHRRRVPRVAGTTLSYLAFFVVVGLAFLAVVPLAAGQADELSDELPAVRADVEGWINDRAADTEGWIIQIPSVGEIEDDIDDSAAEEGSLSQTFDRVRDIGGRIFHVALIIFLAPIIAFYLLIDLPRLRVVAEGLVPRRSRSEVNVVARRLSRAIGGFFRGQLVVALIVGVMASTGLAIIDLPFWLIVGMVAGLFNMVPLIGPWVGAVPGIIIALTTRDVGTAIWVAAIMAGAQQIDNHFISPMVMQRAVKLHPAVVMLALLAGGTLGGFFGLLIAVPTTALLKIIGGHLWRTYVLGEPFEELAVEELADDETPGVGPVRDLSEGEQGKAEATHPVPSDDELVAEAETEAGANEDEREKAQPAMPR